MIQTVPVRGTSSNHCQEPMKNWIAFYKMHTFVLVSHECLEDQKRGHEVATILDIPKILSSSIFALELSRELSEIIIPQHKHYGYVPLGRQPLGCRLSLRLPESFSSKMSTF